MIGIIVCGVILVSDGGGIDIVGEMGGQFVESGQYGVCLGPRRTARCDATVVHFGHDTVCMIVCVG